MAARFTAGWFSLHHSERPQTLGGLGPFPVTIVASLRQI